MDQRQEIMSSIEGAMMRLRRGMSRRTLGQMLTATITPPIGLTMLGVIDAVEQGLSSDLQTVTVGDVSQRMAVDPSRASRVVTEAVDQGFIVRVAWQSDGRRSGLKLTEQGTDIANQAHNIRQRYYRELMSDWSAQEQRQFAEMLSRFTEAMSDIETGVDGAINGQAGNQANYSPGTA